VQLSQKDINGLVMGIVVTENIISQEDDEGADDDGDKVREWDTLVMKRM